MRSTDPEFKAMIDEIQSFISRRVTKEWTDLFGSAVLFTTPRACADFDWDVTGWVNPRDGADKEDLLPQCFINLCMTMMVAESMDPGQLHGMVMRAAAACGKALVIGIGDEFDGMTQN